MDIDGAPDLRGVIPRAMEQVFSRKANDVYWTYSLEVKPPVNLLSCMCLRIEYYGILSGDLHGNIQ